MAAVLEVQTATLSGTRPAGLADAYRRADEEHARICQQALASGLDPQDMARASSAYAARLDAAIALVGDTDELAAFAMAPEGRDRLARLGQDYDAATQKPAEAGREAEAVEDYARARDAFASTEPDEAGVAHADLSVAAARLGADPAALVHLGATRPDLAVGILPDLGRADPGQREAARLAGLWHEMNTRLTDAQRDGDARSLEEAAQARRAASVGLAKDPAAAVLAGTMVRDMPELGRPEALTKALREDIRTATRERPERERAAEQRAAEARAADDARALRERTDTEVRRRAEIDRRRNAEEREERDGRRREGGARLAERGAVALIAGRSARLKEDLADPANRTFALKDDGFHLHGAVRRELHALDAQRLDELLRGNAKRLHAIEAGAPAREGERAELALGMRAIAPVLAEKEPARTREVASLVTDNAALGDDWRAGRPGFAVLDPSGRIEARDAAGLAATWGEERRGREGRDRDGDGRREATYNYGFRDVAVGTGVHMVEIEEKRVDGRLVRNDRGEDTSQFRGRGLGQEETIGQQGDQSLDRGLNNRMTDRDRRVRRHEHGER